MAPVRRRARLILAVLFLLALAAVVAAVAVRATAVSLTPRVYLPIVVKGAVITEPPPTMAMDLYIENNTGGRLCYQVLDVGPVECVEDQGKAYYKTVLYGQYRFWGRGCENNGYVLGLAPFYYRSATLAFACCADGTWIWAKMYEFGG